MRCVKVKIDNPSVLVKDLSCVSFLWYRSLNNELILYWRNGKPFWFWNRRVHVKQTTYRCIFHHVPANLKWHHVSSHHFLMGFVHVIHLILEMRLTILIWGQHLARQIPEAKKRLLSGEKSFDQCHSSTYSPDRVSTDVAIPNKYLMQLALLNHWS